MAVTLTETVPYHELDWFQDDKTLKKGWEKAVSIYPKGVPIVGVDEAKRYLAYFDSSMNADLSSIPEDITALGVIKTLNFTDTSVEFTYEIREDIKPLIDAKLYRVQPRISSVIVLSQSKRIYLGLPFCSLVKL